jgi:hypothetical protein
MRNTIRKVSTVVAVFTTSCQVSEKLKKGPETAQRTISPVERINADGLPVTVLVHFATLLNSSSIAP